MIKDKDSEIEALVKERDEEKRKKGRAIEKAELQCIKESEKFYNQMKIIAYGLLILITVIGIGILTLYYFGYCNINPLILTPLFLITICSFIDLIVGRTHFINRYLIILKNKKFDTLYSEEIKRINQYFESDL